MIDDFYRMVNSIKRASDFGEMYAEGDRASLNSSFRIGSCDHGNRLGQYHFYRSVFSAMDTDLIPLRGSFVAIDASDLSNHTSPFVF